MHEIQKMSTVTKERVKQSGETPRYAMRNKKKRNRDQKVFHSGKACQPCAGTMLILSVSFHFFVCHSGEDIYP